MSVTKTKQQAPAQTKTLTAREVEMAPMLVGPGRLRDDIPLVTQFLKYSKERKAYVINPDGSIAFDLDPWDGE